MIKEISTTGLLIALFTGNTAFADAEYQPVQHMLDLSGLAWLGDDRFLAVHDSKNPYELESVRVSFLKTPGSSNKMMWAPLNVDFPGGLSSDLESASRVPDTNLVILAESNDNAGDFRRLFLAEFDDSMVTVLSSLSWTEFSDPFNVEATAVASTQDGYIFIWAERNSGKQNTEIKWSKMTLEPFSISAPLGSVSFTLSGSMSQKNSDPLYNRSIVGMDVDNFGNLYTVAVNDTGADNGPFRSVIFKVGYVDKDGDVNLLGSPEMLGTVDGLKVESISLVEGKNERWLYFGTDDENYNGTLRRLSN